MGGGESLNFDSANVLDSTSKESFPVPRVRVEEKLTIIEGRHGLQRVLFAYSAAMGLNMVRETLRE